MAKYTNPAWLEHSIQDIKNGESVLSNKTMCIKDLCMRLALKNIPYSVTKMPGGISRIQKDDTVCPCCGKPMVD